MSDSSPLRSDRLRWITLVAILVFASAFRFYDIGGQSFWTDEFFALEHAAGHGESHALYAIDHVAKMPASFTAMTGFHPIDIWRGVARDSHPPLYFIALGAWRQLSGDGEWASRSLSAVLSVAALAAIIAAIKTHVGWRPALWSGAIIAASGTQTRFAQEARNYTMLMLIVYVILWILLRAVQKKRLTVTPMLVLIALYIATCLTHYLAIMPLAAITLYGLLSLPRREKVRLAATVSISVVIYLVIWLPFLIDQYRHEMMAKMRWMGADPVHGLFAVARELLAWPWESLVDDVRTPPFVRIAFGLGVFAMLIIGGLRQRKAWPWLVIVAFVLGHGVVNDLVSQTHSLAIIRYTFIAAPAVWVAACLTADRWQVTRHFVPLMLLSLCLFRAEGPYLNRKADWRPMATWLQRHAKQDDLIVFAGPSTDLWRTQSVLLATRCYTTWNTADAPHVAVMSGPPSADLQATIARAHEVYVLCSGMAGPPPELFGGLRYETGEIAFPVASAYRLVRSVTTTEPVAPPR